MKRILLAAVILLAATLIFPFSEPTTIARQKLPRAQTTLYGGIGRGPGADRGEVITIDQSTAAGELVGTGAADAAVGITGLAFDTAGELFASTINASIFAAPQSTLIRINPVTGVQDALIGIIRRSNGTSVIITDLALQPGTDVLFGVGINPASFATTIYRIDRDTAIATVVGPTDQEIDAIAFGPDGTFYGALAIFDETGENFLEGFINTLDPASGATLTSAGPYFTHIGGLAVRPTDGVIFASGGFPSDIYTLSTQGVLTPIGVTGFGGVGDIAFTPLPTDKEQCKQGGWQDFNFPFSFKNQGDCIQFVNTGK